jgi:hypothetical protein
LIYFTLASWPAGGYGKGRRDLTKGNYMIRVERPNPSMTLSTANRVQLFWGVEAMGL